MLAPALELRHISKTYQRVAALNNASLSVAPGSLHGLIGENGAGKSSLMQVAYGLVIADEGEILIDGMQVAIENPQHAIEHGIGMLHQKSSWLEQLSVFDNIMLAEPVTGFVYQQRTQARTKLEQLRREFGFTFSLVQPMSELDYSQRQLVDILRSLFRGVKVLILDEPLALLSPEQADYLNSLLMLLKLQGISVIVVSHKLAVLHQLCDVISVIKAGQVIACLEPSSLSIRQLSRIMVGRELSIPHPRNDAEVSDSPLQLSVTNVRVDAQAYGRKSIALPLLADINLQVRGGDIVACVGLPKSGHEALIDVLAGAIGFDQGQLEFSHQKIKAGQRYSVKRAREIGVAYAPNPLRNVGLVGQLPMADSACLGYQKQGVKRWGWVSSRQKNTSCLSMMKQWGVRPAIPQMLSGSFSAGNQQKMVLAREIAQQPNLLLLSEPTLGVDAGAIEYIYQQLFSLRETGASIVFCTNDLDEVMSIADKVCVFSQGRIVNTFNACDINKSQLGLAVIAGATDE